MEKKNFKTENANTLMCGSSSRSYIIASLSIEGVQSVTVVDVNEKGNIDGEGFLGAFIDDILSICESFSGERFIIVMYNAQMHLRLLIDAECLQRNIIILYLPRYSFAFNPIELCFNAAKMKLQKDYALVSALEIVHLHA